MNSTPSSDSDARPLTQEEMYSALFAQMVMHLSSTALIMMGQAPHPGTGKTAVNLEAAQLFVEQIEMLEVKTKGNLGPQEQHLLKQSLTTVRMAFVQAVESSEHATARKSGDAPNPAQK